MNIRMIARHSAVFATGVLLACNAVMAPAAPAVDPLYPKTLETHSAPKLAGVAGREYKFLFQPDPKVTSVEEGFRDVWNRVKASASRNGYTLTEKENDPLTIKRSIKEYFDTRDQALWRKGYVIRITTRYKGGKPGSKVDVTVKVIDEDAVRTLAAPLTVVGAKKVSVQAEDNVGFVPGGKLAGYVEKGASFNVPVKSLGTFTLGDFGRYMPELLRLGLPPDTALVGTRVFSFSVKPGAILLPGIGPVDVAMEAWSPSAGGLPDIYDFSFGYKTPDYSAADQTHAPAEQFMTRVLQAELSGSRGQDDAPWGGSKVRRLMNRPVAAR